MNVLSYFYFKLQYFQVVLRCVRNTLFANETLKP